MSISVDSLFICRIMELDDNDNKNDDDGEDPQKISLDWVVLEN